MWGISESRRCWNRLFTPDIFERFTFPAVFRRSDSMRNNTVFSWGAVKSSPRVWIWKYRYFKWMQDCTLTDFKFSYFYNNILCFQNLKRRFWKIQRKPMENLKNSKSDKTFPPQILHNRAPSFIEEAQSKAWSTSNMLHKLLIRAITFYHRVLWPSRRSFSGLYFLKSSWHQQYRDCTVPYVRHFPTGYGIFYCDLMKYELLCFTESQWNMPYPYKNASRTGLPNFCNVFGIVRSIINLQTKHDTHWLGY